MDASSLLSKAKKYLPPEKLALVEAAYQYALNAHQGQLRKSGAPYLDHPLETAITLAEIQLDAATLAAALLHDVPEDCGVPLADIETTFGPEVAKLVDGTTKLSKVSWHTSTAVKQAAQAENLRKMLIAMAEDLRVVFIKLADRLNNMHTLDALSPEKQHSIAQETLEIYAPLAHRLGIWTVKWQLEDLSFRYLEPQQYHKIARLLDSRRAQREEFIAKAIQTLRHELEKADIKAEVSGRPKHIYSIYHKMSKYAAQGKNFGDIHDLLAFRILVDTVSDCYKALGVIHNLWHPLPDEFNDFIANPKNNGYQSLHTTVLSQGMTPLEIQIRTVDMHRSADYGVAAHWRYKESSKQDVNFENNIAWLRQLIQWQSEVGSDDFLESLKTDVFIDQVFVYTPKGEIKALPKDATPLDFAYSIHTELGHRCIGAKVNGKLVPLNCTLKNSDIVAIMATKTDRGPSLDWINLNLGYTKTSHAREKIRQWFNKQERTQNIDRGKQILDKELKRLGISLGNSEEMALLFNYENLDDFLAAVGSGNITPHQLALKLVTEPEPSQTTAEIPFYEPEKVMSAGIQVLGVGDLLTHLASCCRPLPGDDIAGYITRSQGVTVHRRDCVNIVNEKEKERLIDVNWGQIQELYPVCIQVDAWDRVGLLRDFTTLIAEEKVNISTITTTENDSITSIIATVDIKNMAQLTQLLSKIQGVRGVTSAVRKSKIKASSSH